MTLTLELTPEQERRLIGEAAAHGLEMQDYALGLILGEMPQPKTQISEERARQIEAARRLRGSLAHLEGASSYQFIEDKKREMELEDRF
ncbi:MAG: hypothetical protein JO250_16195 [Armatimonadetes bacterium]|nr:hypothetical protein [Armatimonadota bacterium]